MLGRLLVRRLAGGATMAAFSLVFGAACGETSTGTAQGDDLSFEVSLLNGDALSGKPIHMFAPGETFPCCQVPQLEWRDIQVTKHKANTQITFSVGRNGNVLKSVSCTVKDPDNKIVKWVPSASGSDSGQLVCQVGW